MTKAHIRRTAIEGDNEIVTSNGVRIRVADVQSGGRVWLAIEAPDLVDVWRGEIPELTPPPECEQ